MDSNILRGLQLFADLSSFQLWDSARCCVLVSLKQFVSAQATGRKELQKYEFQYANESIIKALFGSFETSRFSFKCRNERFFQRILFSKCKKYLREVYKFSLERFSTSCKLLIETLLAEIEPTVMKKYEFEHRDR